MSELMGEDVVIVMNGEPSGKGRPKFVRATGRAFTPEKTRNFEENLSWAGQVAMAGRPLLQEPVVVKIWAYMSVPKSMPKKRLADALLGRAFPARKPDADNIAKSVLDALNKVCFVDDGQVVDLHVFKRYSEQPRLEIRISSKST